MGLIAAAGKTAQELAGAARGEVRAICIAADGTPKRAWPIRIATASRPKSSTRPSA